MKPKNRKASILAVSLIIMGVMIVISLGIASSALQSRKSSIGASKSNVAFQAADSGVEILMQKIKNNLSGTIADIDTDGTCDGIFNVASKYSVEIKDSSGDIISNCASPVSSIDRVKSTGYSSQDSRAIEAAVVAACSGGGITNGLIGYWNLDENSGSNANDTNSFIPANDAAITNASWTSGKFGSAINFDGSSRYAETPEIADPGPYGDLQQGSISAWVNVDQIDNACAWWGWKNVVASYSSTQGSLSYMEWYLGNDFQKFGGDCAGDAQNMHIVQEWKAPCVGGPHAILKTTNPIDITSVTGWHLVTFTTNGTDTAEIYWDGVKQPSEFLPADCGGIPTGSKWDFLNDINNMGGPFYGHFFDIGALHTMSGVNTYYNGPIDDVRIYNRALDSCDVSSLYNNVPSFSCTGAVPGGGHATLCSGDNVGLAADTPRTLTGSCGAPKCEYTCDAGYNLSGGTCVPVVADCTGTGKTVAGGLRGFWNLNEGSGNNANDSSTSNNDGTLFNNPAWFTGGINFDGVNDYIETAANDRYDSYNAGTVLAWAKFDNLNPNPNPVGTENTIAAYNTTEVTDSMIDWDADVSSPGYFTLEQGWKTAADPGAWNWIKTDPIPVDSNCHLVTFTNDGASQTKIYLDGILQTATYTQESGVGNQTDFINDINAVASHAHYFDIGVRHRAIDASVEPTGTSRFFRGQIGEVQIYNRALTPAEINSLK